MGPYPLVGFSLNRLIWRRKHPLSLENGVIFSIDLKFPGVRRGSTPVRLRTPMKVFRRRQLSVQRRRRPQKTAGQIEKEANVQAKIEH